MTLTPEEAKLLKEQAAFDRIIGMTQGKFIQVKGQSYRRPLK